MRGLPHLVVRLALFAIALVAFAVTSRAQEPGSGPHGLSLGGVPFGDPPISIVHGSSGS